VAIDQSRENAGALPRGTRFEGRGMCTTKIQLGVLVFFLVEFGVTLHGDNEPEFPPCHALQFTFQPVSVATKQLHNFRILDTIKNLIGFE
jgi:hypothetical protein